MRGLDSEEDMPDNQDNILGPPEGMKAELSKRHHWLSGRRILSVALQPRLRRAGAPAPMRGLWCTFSTCQSFMAKDRMHRSRQAMVMAYRATWSGQPRRLRARLPALLLHTHQWPSLPHPLCTEARSDRADHEVVAA